MLGHTHLKDIAKVLKTLEESEGDTLEKVANIEACIDAMAEDELKAWVSEATPYVEQISSFIDAAKETKRVKSGWLNGLAAEA